MKKQESQRVIFRFKKKENGSNRNKTGYYTNYNNYNSIK